MWDVLTGEMVNTLIHHCEAVLHLRFYNGMMVTCSKDRSIAVWDMVSKQGCQMAKFDPFLSLDCARVDGVGAQFKKRKESNFTE